MSAAGILGIGVYLPETVRRNDWWPAHVVQRWREKALHRVEQLPLPRTEGVERALAAMAEYRDDPFNGAVERRVMAPDEWSSEMELAAAREALERSGVAAAAIDALISFTVVPDYLSVPTGAVLQERLGLRTDCWTMSIEGACNSFPMQLTIADQAIRSGRMRHVLLVTSSAYSRLHPIDWTLGAWMGDGATAVVLGSVSDELGILSYAHGTEGAAHRAVVHGVPGRRWYEDGRVVAYSEDKAAAQSVILGSVDRCKYVVTSALAQVRLTSMDVDFYAGHQGGPWLRRVTQEFTGMERARFVDTFAKFGNLGAANIPLILSIAEREGLLHTGDLVATFSAGSGQTYASVALRWGIG
jgi:3-oxoacyl-[acyl-carrier-protein] synthase-3